MKAVICRDVIPDRPFQIAPSAGQASTVVVTSTTIPVLVNNNDNGTTKNVSIIYNDCNLIQSNNRNIVIRICKEIDNVGKDTFN